MKLPITTSAPTSHWRPVLAGSAALAMGLGIVTSSVLGGATAEAAPAKALKFDEASVQFVDNRTDHDGQLFWSVTYEKRMADVTIHAPNGKRVATASFDRTGQADAHFDSPEPTVAVLKRTYPAGRYKVTGHTTSGRRLVSTVVLNYKQVAKPIITSPTRNQANVPTTGLVVRWNAIRGATSIHLQVERDAPHRALEIDLPGTVTEFQVPDSFLKPGTEYVVDVMAKHPGSSYTMSDVTFTTKP